MSMLGLILGVLDANNKHYWCREFTIVGNIRFLHGDYSTAKFAYETALRFDDDNWIARKNLAETVEILKLNEKKDRQVY